jgi:hypothetical protein
MVFGGYIMRAKDFSCRNFYSRHCDHKPGGQPFSTRSILSPEHTPLGGDQNTKRPRLNLTRRIGTKEFRAELSAAPPYYGCVVPRTAL